jgi:DNA repair exonuclease SbcCD ATPase subunit
MRLEKIRKFVKEHRKAFIGMVCIAIVIFGVLAWTNNEFSNPRTSIQTQELQIQQLNSTVQQLQTQIQGLLQLLDDISRLEKEIEKQNKTIWQLQEKLEKIENTTWDSVNNYVKSVPKGWDAKTMAQDLEEKFWVETRIIEHNGVKYLFLRFKCNCCGSTQEWWVTWRGLLPSDRALVQPTPDP